MAKVTIIQDTERLTVQAEVGQTLGELLRKVIPSFAMPCNGNHTCGKCLVQVFGAVSEAEETEQRLLEEYTASAGMRLACCCNVEGDAKVIVPSAKTAKILSWYQIPEVKATERGYGFAVDIGTTTVAVQLIDRADGRVLSERVAQNAQRGFGADVISRIEACKTAGLQILSERIAQQLEEMAAECLQESGVKCIEESVVTGNTTMLHLYEGLDPASLAVAPFKVQSYFDCTSRRTLAGAPVYLPRCIGAYVGADVVCAAAAADLTCGGVQLLTDIGTNGEIVLVRDGRVSCCATAAGPAFEGTGLSRGMPASTGAIRMVQKEADVITYETVHHAPAVGICGSGILDALSVMLDENVLEPTGYLEKEWEIADSGIQITQKDVRQIQLAKAAICGGILTLLEAESISAEELDRFVVAGGFGSSMNHASAAAIGLYPWALHKKAEFLGNGALGGAVMLLRSKVFREKVAEMAKNARELSLSASAEFMDYYVDCMSFEVL